MYKIKLFILQSIGRLLKLLNRGSSLVGYLDGKLNFNILNNIDLTNKKVIFIVGTNGKTTVTNIINELYEANDKPVLSNLEGANMITGIKNALIMELKGNKIEQDILLLEVDEKNVGVVSELIKPTDIILTNFFRDQLDRYFEISITIEEIVKVIKKHKPTVYYNGQDPLIYDYFRNTDIKQIKYSINKTVESTQEQTAIVEIKYCPNCKIKLDYDFYHYTHIGEFSCKTCDFKVNSIKYNFDIKGDYVYLGDKKLINFMPNTPQYLISNYCLILDFALNNNLSLEKMDNIISNQNQVQGRNNNIIYNDKEIYLNLAKNVAGMEQSILQLNKLGEKVDLLIAFNDNYADGKDVSWIWDVEFEKIIDNLNSLHIVGSRKHDMQLRFLYEGYENIKMYETINEGLKEIVKTNNPKIITNYTPLKDVLNFFNSGDDNE